MPSQDALRSSLDSHQVDRKAGRDRDYVESVLRRIQAPTATAQVSEPSAVQQVEPEVVESTDHVPAFTRVKAMEHPRETTPEPVMALEDVEFKELGSRPRRQRPSKAKKGAESPVIWEDVTEGEDPDRKPTPAAGYMKGNYALLRRQLDTDHAVYFFATEVPDDAEQTRIPANYEVRLTEETRLPYIARKGKAAHLNQTTQLRAKDRDEAIELAARKGIGGLTAEA